ncbi:hypothetical protein IB60_17405 [Brucella abortus LMN1]|uniref:hypothetical protein n=1 Tax=Brucella abortus TaxID=235 RepID=UPI0004E87232|nr:hypothetical protein [Brucella abortus]KFH18473.1 hypothetical protein IB60_17405 [Brucella abortus LMN1]
MAEIREVTVSRSVRVNTGNYEGTEHFVSMRATLDELDTVEEATAEVTARVERAMVAQLHRSYQVRGKKDMTPEKVARHHGLTHLPRED